MARYGAKYIKWAPFAEQNAEPENAMPVYGTAIQLAELQKVSDNPTFAEGKQPGDDALVEYVSEFSEADVDVEVTDLPLSVEVPIFGAEGAAGQGNAEAKFGSDDIAPYGGLGFISCRVRKNVKSYQGIFYPKLKAVMQGEEYNTRGESITLAGGKLKFKAMLCNAGCWKIKSTEFPTEAAARQWVDSKLGAT